ncbi:glycosyltransferase family 32 protein [Pedobacter sp. AW31-3R]|uniref:glycosyltransferase family 32 protein n=1 Tax=Pedobacter sp. AW31-3R TaxID=3445781 RepID=UPI003FA066F0
MSIPKIIHQTFKTSGLPLITRWHISKFRKRNPEYAYEFYDDERIEQFIADEYNEEILQLYRKINIGAAKADFFRYLILFKKGGIYLDIDSSISGKLKDFIQPNDSAIISSEKNPGVFVQWALIFEANHPFLNRTIELVCENIRKNTYPHDVHQMTGPSVYTKAIQECLKKSPDIPYRILGIDYNGHLKFKYPMSKLLYQKGEHWKKAQLIKPVLRTE